MVCLSLRGTGRAGSETGGSENMAKKAISSKNDDYRMDTLLTMREACQVLRVHSNTLRRWCRAGLVQEYRIGVGHHRRFRRSDIDALLVEHQS